MANYKGEARRAKRSALISVKGFMRKLAFLLVVLFSVVKTGFGQWALFVGEVPKRIPVMHADPWVVVSLLKGVSPPYPELSTLMWFIGIAEVGNDSGRWLVPEGILIVNPADNSIWYMPKRQG